LSSILEIFAFTTVDIRPASPGMPCLLDARVQSGQE
jgi:hypothetical protein